MTLDFSDIEVVKKQVHVGLNGDSSIPEWKKEIFTFLNWCFSSDLYLIQKTSGSTGDPKEIKLTRKVLLASANATITFFNLPRKSAALLCIPARFIGGKMMLTRAIIGEWSLNCIAPKSDLNSALQQEVMYEFSAMIPIQVQNLLKHNAIRLAKVKNLIIGGAAVSLELENELCNANINAYSTYGMTETASHVALKKLDRKSNFRALNGISFSADHENRLIIASDRIPISPLLTNDVVELHSETSFKWLGRFDNVINSGGVKIFTEELERTIAPLLAEKFYISKKLHPELGETPVLVINCEKWEDEKISSFLAVLKEKVPSYWNPQKILFSSNFHKTDSGKIKRI